MTTGIILLNFGEPEQPTRGAVIDYLTRIFRDNASLEEAESPAAVERRSRELAERRADGLLADYARIGGSPLLAQVRAQATALRTELGHRRLAARTYVGMQFTDPDIRAAVAAARADGVDSLVGLPLYPLCGRSTTVAALDRLAHAVRELGWGVERHDLSGWHRHPEYVALRADAIRRYADAAGVDLGSGDTLLYFSAHGTPVRYLDAGSRYDRYVEESCRLVATALGAKRHVIGFQNHANRGLAWTQPGNEELIRKVDAARVLVVPISFMHEQSETLAELDLELRSVAEEAGLEFHRVPVPHDDPRFPRLLADLVEPFLRGRTPAAAGLIPCRCRAAQDTWCLGGGAPS